MQAGPKSDQDQKKKIDVVVAGRWGQQISPLVHRLHYRDKPRPQKLWKSSGVVELCSSESFLTPGMRIDIHFVITGSQTTWNISYTALTN